VSDLAVLTGSTVAERGGERPAELVVTLLARDRWGVAADLVRLTKPRVVLMVLVTTLAGYYAGLRGPADYPVMLHLLVGTLLAAGGTMALNQYWERDVDGRMARTRHRPLPAGRLQPLEALLFGTLLVVTGVAYLASLVSGLAALVTLFIALLYLFVYTPLKRRSPLCTLVGAVPGALPPVTGWLVARQDLGVGAGILFGILFLWQLPHTLAIARLYRDDYARAGVRVWPVVEEGPATERQIVASSLGLLAVSLLPTLVGLAGPLYFAGALLLGLGLAGCGMAQALAPSVRAARRVLWGSLVYLPGLLGLLALDRL
jgi:protoheme IX farnesyltransferase